MKLAPTTKIPVRSFVPAAALLCSLAFSQAALAQPARKVGALAADDGQPVWNTTVRSLIIEKIPDPPKLFVLNECFGGNFLSAFAFDTDTAIASGTSPGQSAYARTYDRGTSFGVRPEPGRTAVEMHAEGIAAIQTAETPPPTPMTPMTGGALALSGFPLQRTGFFDQRNLNIVFYAAGAEDTDLLNIQTIKEFYPDAFYQVLGDASLQNHATGPASYEGLAAAFEAVHQRASSLHEVIFYVCGHGALITLMGEEEEVGVLPDTIPTEPLPEETRVRIEDQANPAPLIGILIPLEGTGVTYDPEGTPPIAAGSWSVQVPLTAGVFASSSFTLVSVGGLDGVVGDDAGDAMRLEFAMPAADFIDAFVGRPNAVTVTNNTGQVWTIELYLDEGPIAGVLPEPCAGDYNGIDGVTVQDIYDFLSDWNIEVGEEFGNADFNGEDGVTVQDIYDFLGAWNAGCP